MFLETQETFENIDGNAESAGNYRFKSKPTKLSGSLWEPEFSTTSIITFSSNLDKLLIIKRKLVHQEQVLVLLFFVEPACGDET